MKTKINWKRFIKLSMSIMFFIVFIIIGINVYNNINNSNSDIFLSGNSTSIEHKMDRYLANIDKRNNDYIKVAYLTFDDGPTPGVTDSILDTLDSYGIKVTFFMIGSNMDRNPDMVKDVDNRGHQILNHTYSHDYQHIYENAENFLKDVNKWDKEVKKILPKFKNRKIMRFPGGSFGRSEQKAKMEEVGYEYIDWNAVTGDAELQNATVDYLKTRLQETTINQKKLVLLMHDASDKQTTAEVLPWVIEFLVSKGYVFDVL